MTKLGAIRFLEMMGLEHERELLMRGMLLLMNAHGHLQKTTPQLEENISAIQQIVSIVGPMENENKVLAEKAGELWRAVLELDGPELSSKQIEKEENDAATGLDWLNRAINRVAEVWPVEEGGEDILVEMADLRNRLQKDRHALREAQRQHQMAQAEILAGRTSPYEN